MPPKAKFTREQIADAALALVRRKGPDALTARDVAKELGSSARPIFTVYEGMDDLRAEVEKRAEALYASLVDAGLKEDVAFKGVGKAYIKFAASEPQLFRMLFMREKSGVPYTYETAIRGVEKKYGEILDSIIDGYGLSPDDAMFLYMRLWIFSHGIATLIATGVCAFTPDEISGMLTDVCSGVLIKLRKEKK